MLRQRVGLPADATMAEVDASGLKRLFSHGIRRMKSRSETSES